MGLNDPDATAAPRWHVTAASVPPPDTNKYKRPSVQPFSASSPPRPFGFKRAASARPRHGLLEQMQTEQIEAQRRMSQVKLYNSWTRIYDKYSSIPLDEDDELDWLCKKVVRDRGALRRLEGRDFAEPEIGEYEEDEEDEDIVGPHNTHFAEDEDELGDWDERSGLDRQFIQDRRDRSPSPPAPPAVSEADQYDIREFLKLNARMTLGMVEEEEEEDEEEEERGWETESEGVDLTALDGGEAELADDDDEDGEDDSDDVRRSAPGTEPEPTRLGIADILKSRSARPTLRDLFTPPPGPSRERGSDRAVRFDPEAVVAGSAERVRLHSVTVSSPSPSPPKRKGKERMAGERPNETRRPSYADPDSSDSDSPPVITRRSPGLSGMIRVTPRPYAPSSPRAQTSSRSPQKSGLTSPLSRLVAESPKRTRQSVSSPPRSARLSSPLRSSPPPRPSILRSSPPVDESTLTSELDRSFQSMVSDSESDDEPPLRRFPIPPDDPARYCKAVTYRVQGSDVFACEACTSSGGERARLAMFCHGRINATRCSNKPKETSAPRHTVDEIIPTRRRRQWTPSSSSTPAPEPEPEARPGLAQLLRAARSSGLRQPTPPSSSSTHESTEDRTPLPMSGLLLPSPSSSVPPDGFTPPPSSPPRRTTLADAVANLRFSLPTPPPGPTHSQPPPPAPCAAELMPPPPLPPAVQSSPRKRRAETYADESDEEMDLVNVRASSAAPARARSVTARKAKPAARSSPRKRHKRDDDDYVDNNEDGSNDRESGEVDIPIIVRASSATPRARSRSASVAPRTHSVTPRQQPATLTAPSSSPRKWHKHDGEHHNGEVDIPIIVRASSATPRARSRSVSVAPQRCVSVTPQAKPETAAPKSTPQRHTHDDDDYMDNDGDDNNDSDDSDLWGMDEDAGDAARCWREASAVTPLQPNWREMTS